MSADNAPAPFGHANLAEWPHEAGCVYLNHGTVGVAPRAVMKARHDLLEEIEAHPSRFLLRELAPDSLRAPHPSRQPRLRAAAESVASFLGARAEDLVFVDNATAGINAVVQSLTLSPGDELVLTDLGYGAINRVAEFAARRVGARVRIVEMPYPVASPAQWVEAISAALTPKTRLAIVDHITSESALLLPLREIAAACRARGVRVLADGAHAPGAIALEIPPLGVDYYVGNLHKWAWAPRSCGFLWAAPEHHAQLHPPVISWGLDGGFANEFDWMGTRDPTPWLTAPFALQELRKRGVEEVRRWNHALAWAGYQLLAERWGTQLLCEESMVGTMATVPLPLHLGSTREAAVRVRTFLLETHRIEVQLHAWRGRLWARISAQIYNELSDYERLAEAVLSLR